MTNVCEICGCENPATRMYEKEGEVFRMICDFHDKQVNEKKVRARVQMLRKDDIYLFHTRSISNPL